MTVMRVSLVGSALDAGAKRALATALIVRAATDMPRHGNGADFWMTIDLVPEGGWGLGGRPVSIAQLAPVFAEDRQSRIRAYMAAREDA